MIFKNDKVRVILFQVTQTGNDLYEMYYKAEPVCMVLSYEKRNIFQKIKYLMFINYEHQTAQVNTFTLLNRA